MLDLRADDWFTITGRGRVAAFRPQHITGTSDTVRRIDDLPVRVGDQVRIDGDEYTVRGIEYSRALVDPPFITAVSLQVS